MLPTALVQSRGVLLYHGRRPTSTSSDVDAPLPEAGEMSILRLGLCALLASGGLSSDCISRSAVGDFLIFLGLVVCELRGRSDR